MSGFFLTTLITALSLLVVNLVIPGVEIPSFITAILAAISIGAVNGVVKPILVILSLPVTILSLGFFALIVNGFCFWLASVFVPGFTVHGVLAFLLGPIVLSVVSALLTNLAIREGIGVSPENEMYSQSTGYVQGDRRVETVTPAETNVTIDVVPNSD
ncbi:MAG: phage holin family protein [Leptolyngbyaceae bacterium]|nr:phage holin family protein [Leptolyngbyaceae bacterium]